MNRFDPAASDYTRCRPGIPGEAVQLLAGTLGGIDQPALLDLGSGTGRVPAALLPAVPRIAVVDPVDRDNDMLRTASGLLRPLLGQSTAALHSVAAEEFSAPFDGCKADLVTCARAFHRMDRPAAPAMADRVTTPEATVAVMGDGSLWTHEVEWTSALKELIQSCLGAERRADASGVYTEPRIRYEDDLAESAFSDATKHRFPIRHTWASNQVVGCLRGTSFACPELFGHRHGAFEADALRLLDGYACQGGLVKAAVFTVLLARRGGGA
ncbi:class I SAM-dependent methyltransferase [Streptomyces sp. Ncost-T10-10d]|uniref:class I SAM-dependent methyltransferase n=1 Tax=Streptomyces sp. Ncost-T10-10d TaxID=1839774 RepID=UPI00081EDBC6|nr:class I SAM-dependent methyltransferase [Streptomyces sp. Ncost-T10-10d]SCF95677.1 Methyltransferase domain-containing protein [Streptomyces sp. Ncost-T10-10d]